MNSIISIESGKNKNKQLIQFQTKNGSENILSNSVTQANQILEDWRYDEIDCFYAINPNRKIKAETPQGLREKIDNEGYSFFVQSKDGSTYPYLNI